MNTMPWPVLATIGAEPQVDDVGLTDLRQRDRHLRGSDAGRRSVSWNRQAEQHGAD
jgi:hypothetical protein